MDAAAGVTGTGPGAYQSYRMSQVGADLLHFGGRDKLAQLSADFFNYSTSSKAWTKLDAAAGVTGTGPIARWFHAMTTVDQDIFVFGGATNSDGGEFCIPLAVLGLRKVGSAVLAGDHPSKGSRWWSLSLVDQSSCKSLKESNKQEYALRSSSFTRRAPRSRPSWMRRQASRVRDRVQDGVTQ